MTRDERQDIAIELYRKSGAKGTLNHTTGFGKTYETRKIINKIKEKNGDFHYIIVVPTTPLKEQWSRILENDDDNHEVLTIQSLLLNKKELECYFLVIDEIHKFAADQFSKIFELIKYKFILGLTATYDRLDGKQVIIDHFCPIVDTITLEEARRNGWVADFIEYNWGIEFSEEERRMYEEYNENIDKHFPFFNTDYDLVISCCSTYGAGKFIDKFNPKPIVDNIKLEGKALVNYITSKANICKEYFEKRRELLDNSNSKIDAVIEAVHYLKMKTVTFGLSTNTADIITDKLGKISTSYHSKIPTQVMNVPNKKGQIKPRKVGSKTLQEMILKDFNDDKYLVMNTAKKADLGLDVKGLRVGIIYAGTKDPGVHDQRRGRVTRYEEILDNGEVIIKKAIIINIFIRNTKDEYNLKMRQKNSFRVRTITNINQVEK